MSKGNEDIPPKLRPVPSSGDADRIPHAVTIRPDFLLVAGNGLKLEKKKRKKVDVHESQQLRNRLVKPRFECIRRFVFRRSFRPLSSSDAVRGGTGVVTRLSRMGQNSTIRKVGEQDEESP